MGRDCPSAGLPPRSDARSGLSVTLATGSGELADDPAHRVRDAATKTGSDAFIRPQHDGGGERVRSPDREPPSLSHPSLPQRSAKFASPAFRVRQSLTGRAAFGPELPLAGSAGGS